MIYRLLISLYSLQVCRVRYTRYNKLVTVNHRKHSSRKFCSTLLLIQHEIPWRDKSLLVSNLFHASHPLRILINGSPGIMLRKFDFVANQAIVDTFRESIYRACPIDRQN